MSIRKGYKTGSVHFCCAEPVFRCIFCDISEIFVAFYVLILHIFVAFFVIRCYTNNSNLQKGVMICIALQLKN